MFKTGILLFALMVGFEGHQFNLSSRGAFYGYNILNSTTKELKLSQKQPKGGVNFLLPDAKPVSDFHLLQFTVDTPEAGTVVLYYYTETSKKLVSIDHTIRIVPGKNNYELDLRDLSCGKEFHHKDVKDFQKFGANTGTIHGIRIDSRFPIGTEFALSGVKLGQKTKE